MDNNTQGASQSSQATAIKRRILIVEDDFFLRDLYIMQANKEGFEVEEAEDGEAGIQKARQGNFDAILIDLMIPKIDGITLIKTLKADPKFTNVPCIVITNLEDATKEQEARSSGAACYLLKIQHTPESIMNTVKTFFK